MTNAGCIMAAMTGSRRFLTAAAAIALLAACDGVQVQESNVPDHFDSAGNPVDFDNRETVLGEGGLFGGNATPGRGDPGGGIGVNAFLWRATLDTVSVWPIASADPFGGVVITDWHSPEAAPSERFKMNVFILGRQLRADGLRVSLFREVRDSAGNWRSASTQKDSPARLEEAILTRARQLRTQSATR